MAGLVVGRYLAFARADDATLAFGTKHHAFNGLVKVCHRYRFLSLAGGENCGFVYRVFNIGTHQPGCGLCQQCKVYVWCQRFALYMHLEDCFAAFDIRPVNYHAPVKAARTQQRRIQNVGAVGGSNNNHMRVGVKAVHLNQDLVERLFALIVAATQSSATLAADGIDLVNKDDARTLALGLFKQIAHAAGSNAHKHFHKFGTRD